MQHQPSSTANTVPSYAVSLAARAMSQGQVVIYAGAGISLSEPTSLPTGAGLAHVIHTKLKTTFPSLSEVDPWDLTAVADTVADLPGGGDALRMTAAGCADFKTASPSYGHRMIAHLFLEGVIDVLTTNWDDCIERGGTPERIQAVTDEKSLQYIAPPSVLKVHGCASAPSSLLVTTEELCNPPAWAREQTHARLGSAVVVFVGIGDVAGYVKNRIEEALQDAGSIENIRVVSPSIVEDWSTSQWSAIAPDLAEENRIAATSDEFMEKLGAAYVVASLHTHLTELESDPQLGGNIKVAVDSLLKTDALRLLEWARGAAVSPQQGVSVLNASCTAEALAALGRLADESINLKPNRTLDTNVGLIEILVATHTMSSRKLVQEARNRLHNYISRGDECPRFLIAGGIGSVAKAGYLPNDVVDENDSADILDGPHASAPEIMTASEVLAS